MDEATARWLHRRLDRLEVLATAALHECADLKAAARALVEAWEGYTVTGPIPHRPTWRDLDALIDALRAALESPESP